MVTEQPRNFKRDYPRLTTACTSQNEHWPINLLNGLVLLGIELVVDLQRLVLAGCVLLRRRHKLLSQLITVFRWG